MPFSRLRLSLRRTSLAPVLTFGLAGALLAGGPAAAEPTLPTTDGCLDEAAARPFEEAFLERDEAQRLIDEGGFKDALRTFTTDLCSAPDVDSADLLVERHAADLWRLAVDRVQGRVDTGGSLSAGDDRPLYWTRLSMVDQLRRWSPGFTVSDGRRQALIDSMDRVSRGQDEISFPAGDRVTRVLVTGFDPFTLWRDVRQANPSGASALALDGVTVVGPDGPIRIEAAVFPVRWRDFEQGMVEETLLPHFREGRKQVDVFATTSQGRVGRIDLEHFNGAWRAGFNDNENICYRGVVPIAPGTPTVEPQPQWTLSTHPIAQMVAADTGPFPVRDNQTVTEVPGDTPEEPVSTSCPAAPSPGTTLTTGPTEGSQARAGAGGNYLSNEVAYRATLLRDALGLPVPGGHIHTPVLQGLDPNRPDELTNETFEANRGAINDQVRQLVLVAAQPTRH